MIQFNKLNKLFGVRKTADFNTPRIIDESEFILPHNSAIIEYDHEYVGDKLYLRTPKQSFVYIVGEYLGEASGKFKRLSINNGAIVSALRKKDEHREFRFVSEKSKLWEVPANKLILIDAYRVKELYRYPKYMGSEFDEYMNRLNNAIMYTTAPDKLTSRNVFMTIKIPKRLPNMSDIRKAAKIKGYRTLAKFGSPDILVIFELLKTLSGLESSFSKVAEKNGSDLVLVFTINGKITMLKYEYLLGLCKANMVDTPISGKSVNAAVLTFIKYLLTISLSSAVPIAQLEKEQMTDVREVSKDDSDDSIDAMIDAHNNTNATVVINVTAKTKRIDIEKEKSKPASLMDSVTEATQSRVERGDITEAVAKKIQDKAKDTADALKTVAITPSDLTIDTASYPDSDTITDKQMLSTTADNMDKLYLKKMYKKQQASAILGASGAGHIVSDHEVEVKSDINNSYEYHSFKIMQPNGRTITRKLIVPTVSPEGIMRINGNDYKLRKQKNDLPIRKISPTQVALTSYYSKVFVRKAEVNRNNTGADVLKQLKARVGADVSMLTLGSTSVVDVVLGTEYTAMSRKIKSFKMNGIFCLFDYTNRKDLIGEDTKYGIAFAKKGKTLYFVDAKNIVKNDKGESFGNLWSWLKLDVQAISPEHANIYLLGHRIPLVLVLTYYYGLDTLINMTKSSIVTHEPRAQVELKDDEFLVKFADAKVVFKRTDTYASILFGALSKMKEIKGVEYSTMNYQDKMVDLFFELGYSKKLSTELDNLTSLWVDPMTMTVLKTIKEPETWKGLLLRSAEMLLNDFAKDQNDTSEILIKGYERLNGMVYNVMSKAIRDNEHRFGNVALNVDINPFEIISMLSEDATVMEVDDINPLESMKQKEEMTLTGKFGRNKEAVSAKDKTYSKTAVGVISEATKDSKDVGVTTYLSAAPKIENLLGMVIEDKSDNTPANVFSSSVALAPEATRDDGKRALYISIQNGHKRPTTSQRILPVRTGYESVVPYRMDKKFITVSALSGEVIKVGAKSLAIKDKDGKVHKFSTRNWTSKIVGGLTFNHEMKTALAVGDMIEAGDILFYDSGYFGPDIFNRKRVVYKGGDTVTVALDEAQEDYEDSGSVSRAFAKKFAMPSVKVRSVILTKDSDVLSSAVVGSKLSYSDLLISFIDQGTEDDLAGLSDRAKAIIAEQALNSPKSKAKGKVIKVEIYYNADKADMTESLLAMVEASDKEMKARTGFTGRVDNSYSIKGKPLLEGELELKFFISKDSELQIGDKAVLVNQLKFTVGKVFNKITADDGTEIDAKFGYRSIGARIVNSPEVIGTTMLILEDLDKEIVKDYFS